tara:strand:+ start:719 stop:874 length:156 start_codon:yes stop_codon:yes gene_type:complete
MPVYLRLFYLKKLNEQHKREKQEYDKAKKGSSSSSKSIKRPSFSKPSAPRK